MIKINKKDKNDLLQSQKLISSVNSVDDAKYLVEKFFTMALNKVLLLFHYFPCLSVFKCWIFKGILAAQKEYLNKELELELGQLGREHQTHQQIIQQFLNGENDYTGENLNSTNGNDFEIDEIILAPHILGRFWLVQAKRQSVKKYCLYLIIWRFKWFGFELKIWLASHPTQDD